MKATPTSLRATVTLLLVGVLQPVPVAAQDGSRAAAVDSIFAEYTGTDIPGCAVGVSEGGEVTLAEAYGMADLEHGVINTPATRFEAGSVSKQFTAAAAVLLAVEGKISLSDDIRTYFPEIPDYGETVTIRHLLNHTSGLRDWGSVAGIEGWPRTTRAHTHVHALDIITRQEELNYPPGRYYSYTNTGYNLLAMLVERVTGQPFGEFSRERIFEPLGLDRTEWRDDFTRVVKDRAIAYAPDDDGAFYMDMPFEDVHGNGGLLTTVGDLLVWTENLETGELGGPRFLEEMHRQGVLTSGLTIAYASGLRVDRYQGVPEVSHSGSTAGYRAFLTRFPEQRVGVAVLCNRADGNAGGLAYDVADLYLGDAVMAGRDDGEDASRRVDPDVLRAWAGTYVSDRTREALDLVADGDTVLTVDGRFALEPVSATEFRVGSDLLVRLATERRAGGRSPLLRIGDGDTVRYEPVPDFDPSPAELRAYTGAYHSSEAEVTYEVRLGDDGGLVMADRYGESWDLEPAYPDAFEGRGRTFVFVRDPSGRVDEMRWIEGRVWYLRFDRVR